MKDECGCVWDMKLVIYTRYDRSKNYRAHRKFKVKRCEIHSKRAKCRRGGK